VIDVLGTVIDMPYGFQSRAHVADWLPGEFFLLETLKYKALNGDVLMVPRRFITDFASVPKAVQFLPGFDVNGNSRRPAVLHDFLYCSQFYPREMCDYLFYEALVSVGYKPAVARLFWLGVRAGGWVYYGKRQAGLVRDSDFVPPELCE
jgi:hypothetical protein